MLDIYFLEIPRNLRWFSQKDDVFPASEELKRPHVHQISTSSPWKINMEPTNHPFRQENDLPNLREDMFQPLIFRGVGELKNDDNPLALVMFKGATFIANPFSSDLP